MVFEFQQCIGFEKKRQSLTEWLDCLQNNFLYSTPDPEIKLSTSKYHKSSFHTSCMKESSPLKLVYLIKYELFVPYSLTLSFYSLSHLIIYHGDPEKIKLRTTQSHRVHTRRDRETERTQFTALK